MWFWDCYTKFVHIMGSRTVIQAIVSKAIQNIHQIKFGMSNLFWYFTKTILLTLTICIYILINALISSYEYNSKILTVPDSTL